MLRHDTKAVHPHVLHGAALIRDVEMEVVFGTPSKNCSGAGICLIANRSTRWETIICPHAPAIIHCLPDQEMVFRFRKRHLSTEAVQAFFKDDKFLVEESFRLPIRLIRHWALPFDRIQPGYYLLEEYSREWRLYFPFNTPNTHRRKHEIL